MNATPDECTELMRRWFKTWNYSPGEMRLLAELLSQGPPERAETLLAKFVADRETRDKPTVRAIREVLFPPDITTADSKNIHPLYKTPLAFQLLAYPKGDGVLQKRVRLKEPSEEWAASFEVCGICLNREGRDIQLLVIGITTHGRGRRWYIRPNEADLFEPAI